MKNQNGVQISTIWDGTKSLRDFPNGEHNMRANIMQNSGFEGEKMIKQGVKRNNITLNIY